VLAILRGIADDHECYLAGGASGVPVVRVGETVRRPLHANSEFVQALLLHLEAVGFEGAPRFLGIDDEGREILSYVEGRVYPGVDELDDQPVTILSDAHLISAGRLIRRFHDATAGSTLAGGAEVVCHPDLGQHNIVFQGSKAVAIIDWDEDVAPGPRILDFAHAVWSLAEIGRQGGAIEEQARRVRLLCDAYRWDDPAAVIDEIGARFRRAIASHTANHKPAAVRIFTDMADWIELNGPPLKSHL
jgi:Phosphotransferase enzyme family